MAAKKQANGKRKYTKRSDKWNGNGAGVPEDFEKIEGAHISGFWIPEKEGQSARGIVGDLITKQGEDGQENTYSLLTLTTNDLAGPVIGQDPDTKRRKKVDVGQGMVIAISGRVLISRIRGREGREVFIVYRGLGEKVPGKNQARLYDVYERRLHS